VKNLNDHNYSHATNGKQLIARVDNRGKHMKHKHRASENDISILKQHIFSFPRERSHYTLNKKETLNAELNVHKMWELYMEQQTQNERRVLGYGRYLKEFNKYDLKFASYKADTCARCDFLKEQLTVSPDNPDLKEQKASHLREADMGYKMQKQDSAKAGNTHQAIWGDMMSVQQIPKLGTGAAFYKRKYKVYNEDFYLASNDQHSMHLWGQMDGKKGAIDVLSCLHTFLDTVPDTRHLICWFDGTSSQLKNSTTLLYFLHRTDPNSPLFQWERVSLKYAPPGHTYMPPDRAFGNVSQTLKKIKVIGDPRELETIINSRVKNTTAQWLDRADHFDWNGYLSQYYTPDKKFMYVDNQPLLMKSRWFSFGYSEAFDHSSGRSILIEHKPHELRARLSFDSSTDWHLYVAKAHKVRRRRAFDTFTAYPEPLILKNERIGLESTKEMAACKIP
jgi:hypothetical protein